MKYISMSLVVLACLAGFTKCSKNKLNENPPHFTTAEILYTSVDGFEAGLNGLYSLVRQERNGLNYTDGFGTIDLAATIYLAGTDNIGSGSNVGGLSQIVADWTRSTPTDPNLDKFFLYLYRMVSASNTLISRSENPDIAWGTPETKARIVSEALVIRAMAYRHLTYLWGKVPFITEERTGENIITDAVRENVGTIRRAMINDLNYAAVHLPWTPLKAGRMTRGVAQTYLAEMYLAIGKADSALYWSDQCITTGPYALISARYGSGTSRPGVPFMDMFEPANVNIANGNKEAMWVLQWERSGVSGGENLMRHETTMRYPNARYQGRSGFLTAIDERGGRGWSRQTITKRALLLYSTSSDAATNKNDQRGSEYAIRKYFVVTTADNYSGLTNTGTNQPWKLGDTVWLATGTSQGNINNCGQRSRSGALNPTLLTDGQANNNDWPHSMKFAQCDPGFPNTTESHTDQMYMRLAETILLRAEAKGRLGNLLGAADDINLLRTRANAKAVTVADFGASLNTFLNYILDERSRELIVEEQRRYTLLRMGGADYFYPRVSTWNTISKNLTLRDTLLPIPQSVIDANLTTVMPQNPGW